MSPSPARYGNYNCRFLFWPRRTSGMEGTYPLPEAQLDRFLFKLLVPFPGREDLNEILRRTTEKEEIIPSKVMERTKIASYLHRCARNIYRSHVRDYASRLVLATHPDSGYAPNQVKQYARYGSSPRGAQALVLAGKIKALLSQRFNVSFDDIKKAAKPALRHRIILNFEGEAERISTDALIDEVLAQTKQEALAV